MRYVIMNEFNKTIDEAIYKLVKMVEKDSNIKEYLWEVYGSVVADNTELCVIQYVADYYNATDDIVDNNR